MITVRLIGRGEVLIPQRRLLAIMLHRHLPLEALPASRKTGADLSEAIRDMLIHHKKTQTTDACIMTVPNKVRERFSPCAMNVVKLACR